MNKVYAAFESFFGGGKTYEPSGETKSNPVTITSYSQPHVLRERMREEKMTHGGTVKANLSPVRLQMDHGKVVMYFCPMKNIEILEVVNKGDGGSIPSQAVVDGLGIPTGFKPGYYELRNVILTSNGSMAVVGTSDTTWELQSVDCPENHFRRMGLSVD